MLSPFCLFLSRIQARTSCPTPRDPCRLLLLLKTIVFRSEVARRESLSVSRCLFKSDTSLKIARRGEERSPDAPFWGDLPSPVCGCSPDRAPLNGTWGDRRQKRQTDHVQTGWCHHLPLPSVNANKLKILLGSIWIFVAVLLLHDRLQCALTVCTHCEKGNQGEQN